MDLQKDEECHLFRSYFIFDVATKRIPLKAEHRRRRPYATEASPSRCFYVPDVLLQYAGAQNGKIVHNNHAFCNNQILVFFLSEITYF